MQWGHFKFAMRGSGFVVAVVCSLFYCFVRRLDLFSPLSIFFPIDSCVGWFCGRPCLFVYFLSLASFTRGGNNRKAGAVRGLTAPASRAPVSSLSFPPRGSPFLTLQPLSGSRHMFGARQHPSTLHPYRCNGTGNLNIPNRAPELRRGWRVRRGEPRGGKLREEGAVSPRTAPAFLWFPPRVNDARDKK